MWSIVFMILTFIILATLYNIWDIRRREKLADHLFNVRADELFIHDGVVYKRYLSKSEYKKLRKRMRKGDSL